MLRIRFLLLMTAASSLLLFPEVGQAQDSKSTPVSTQGPEKDLIPFRTDVMAALSRVGCNSGACHGSPQGKNGFRLSLRGFDPDQDYAILTREGGGRRINRAEPEKSLLLLKGAGRVPHQGGALLGLDSAAYRAILRWIREGGLDQPTTELSRVDVELQAGKTGAERSVRALARFKDGSTRDVSDLAVFSSSDPEVAPVSSSGLVRFKRTGEAAILVRFLDQIASVRLNHVERDSQYVFQGPKSSGPVNPIDEAVFAKQKELQLNPAPLVADEVFLRRVYFDVLGVPPTYEEAKKFLDSSSTQKRAELIDALLERPEYAAFWALKWADILRGNTASISERGVHSFHRYLVRTVAEDRPMTEFARELLTSQGNTLHKPAANFYRVSRTPEEAAEAATQVFMGLRVGCAKCHNHPFESITQTDYYGISAYFARVQFKGSQFGLDDEIVYLAQGREINNPRTRRAQPPVAFGSPAKGLAPDDDRRKAFVDWLTQPDNRYFAPSIVNRAWYHLLGKGVVDPVDDFRDTNPPSNPKLLEVLVQEFVKNEYRMKPLLRRILNSQTYQLSSQAPIQSKLAAKPDRYFVQSMVRMLPAESVLDAVSSSTGLPEKFAGYPLGTRAIELAEGGIQHPFLQAFAKPVRDVSCECAREDDPSLPQTLHLLNNAGLVDKVRSPQGRVARWIKEGKSRSEIIENIYLATLNRRPSAKERELVEKHLQAQENLTAGLQDLQFALMNLNEFLLRH